MTLFYPPEIKLEVLEQKTIPETGFLRVLRSQVKAHYTDETISEPFTVDSIIRNNMDAVVIIGHFHAEYGRTPGRYVYLRSALRPALAFRDYKTSKLPEDEYVGNTFELPAGLVEKDETGLEGFRVAAAREFEEEIGFTVNPEKMNLLGHRIFPTVGMAAERLFFFEVEVNPEEKKEPSLDGHPMEEGASIQAVLLKEAIEYCRKGYLPDAKTEIGLRRLADKYSF